MSTNISAAQLGSKKLKDITKDVRNLKDPDNSGVRFSKTSNPGDGTVLLNYQIGPLLLLLVYTPPDTIGMKAYLILPVVAPVPVADVSGSLTEGISTTIGFKDILSGTITVKRTTEGIAVLRYTFVAFGNGYTGEIILPI